MLFEFLRSLPSGGECLIELNHWRFCLVGETEFLDEFALHTGTMYWTTLTMPLQTVRHTRLSFVCGLWEESRIIFRSFLGNPNTFLYGKTTCLEGWLIFRSHAFRCKCDFSSRFLQMQMRQAVDACLPSISW